VLCGRAVTCHFQLAREASMDGERQSHPPRIPGRSGFPHAHTTAAVRAPRSTLAVPASTRALVTLGLGPNSLACAVLSRRRQPLATEQSSAPPRRRRVVKVTHTRGGVQHWRSALTMRKHVPASVGQSVPRQTHAGAHTPAKPRSLGVPSACTCGTGSKNASQVVLK
jgi:hypothetical protein